MNRRRRTTIDGQFAPRRIDMLRSPAYCELSLSARRILDRVEIELADHGGTDNGKLPITFDDFQRYGIHRNAIGPAIRECVALGFLEITERGVHGTAEFRRPSKFRLTYRAAAGLPGDGTHEWKKITEADAPTIAASARRETPPNKQFLRYGSRQNSVRKPYRKRDFCSTETDTTCCGTETDTTLDISGRGRRDSTLPAHTADSRETEAGPPASEPGPGPATSDAAEARQPRRQARPNQPSRGARPTQPPKENPRALDGYSANARDGSREREGTPAPGGVPVTRGH